MATATKAGRDEAQLTALIVKTANDLTNTSLKSRGHPVTPEQAIEAYKKILRAVTQEVKQISPYTQIKVTIPDE